jgi:hypothetical protein
VCRNEAFRSRFAYASDRAAPAAPHTCWSSIPCARGRVWLPLRATARLLTIRSSPAEQADQRGDRACARKRRSPRAPRPHQFDIHLDGVGRQVRVDPHNGAVGELQRAVGRGAAGIELHPRRGAVRARRTRGQLESGRQCSRRRAPPAWADRRPRPPTMRRRTRGLIVTVASCWGAYWIDRLRHERTRSIWPPGSGSRIRAARSGSQGGDALADRLAVAMALLVRKHH